MYSPFVLLLCILLTSLLVLLLIKKNTAPPRRLPPGPKRLPIIGNLHQINDFSLQSLEKFSQKYGSIFFFQLGSRPTLVVSSPELAKEIFKSHDLTFSGRPELYVAKRMSYERHNVSFSPYGDFWREARKIAIFELLSPKKVQSFREIREEEVAIVLESIADHSPMLVDLSEWAFTLGNNLICRLCFGKRYFDPREGNSNKFCSTLREMAGLLGDITIADYFPSLWWLNKINGVDASVERIFKELDRFYDQILEEHRRPSRPVGDHEDLADVLLRMQKEPPPGCTLDDNQIKGILTDMFIAGSDTSSAAMVWILTELVRNPSIMKKAQDEVRALVKGKPRVKESDLPNLNYLQLIIKEVLRLHPPCPLLVPRETIQTCVLNGYDIPEKTMVLINAKAIQRDENYWEDAKEFRPERFLDISIDYKGQNFELIPFGAGRRGCPGLTYAMVLVKLMVANFIYCFDWKLPNGLTWDDIDREEANGLTVHKKEPLRLVATTTTTAATRSATIS